MMDVAIFQRRIAHIVLYAGFPDRYRLDRGHDGTCDMLRILLALYGLALGHRTRLRR
jgi:hypothetical protein